MRLRAVLFALLAASVASAASAPGYRLLASVTIIHQDSPDKYTVMQTLETLPRANTLALNTKTKKLYLSTAEFEGKTMKPGTFSVLVYGK